MNQTEFEKKFADYDRQVSIHNSKVGSVLASILMPFGFWMDYFLYDNWLDFVQLRCLSSVLTLGVLLLLMTRWGARWYRWLGMAWYMIPAFFIACMIYQARHSISPYYAGFNLVLLTVALILPWAYKEILLTVTLVLGMYLAASYWPGGVKPEKSYLFNNLFFLISTGVIVGTGSYFHGRLRFREFTLRHELDASRGELEESNRKLVELDEAKSRFFANISHELRTPLTLLLAPLETLQRRFKRAIDQESRELLETMHSNGMRLLKLINDLLALVRLESGRMEVKQEPISIPDFLGGLVSAARQMANDKRIQLEAKVESGVGMVLGDRDKLEKILLNLQFNALKFTPAGGRVDLIACREGDQLVLRVRDTGMGISKENKAHVFERFWQADGSSKRKYQGVGIGLSLVKELVKIQGGTVEVDSEESKGALFTVRLPYLPVESPAASPESAPSNSPSESAPAAGHGQPAASEEWLANLYRRAELFPAMTPVRDALVGVEAGRNANLPKVLVADDEPDMLRFLKTQLSGRYQVFEAVDGQQAIEKASQFQPDIILLDMMMPEKDGLQACRELRERPTTQSIPIILLTARADEETKLAALQAGASDFLSKPFSTTELHVRITNLVESFQYQRKLARQNQVLESTIEQLKETEMQLVQTEKLASLGRMSAGLIHEINNPLNFASTGLFTLKRKEQFLTEDQRGDYAEVLKDIEEGITRVKTIVTDLRGFTHHDGAQIDPVDLATVVESAARFLSYDLGENKIRLERQCAEGQVIWANKNKLIQVMVNLLQNSIDALKGRPADAENQPTIVVEGKVESGKSKLIVRDNGSGIKPEHIDKVFDPFFTTKDVGEGMGLGLSICYRIVQEYEGTINVQSEPGKGCAFVLEFPERELV